MTTNRSAPAFDRDAHAAVATRPADAAAIRAQLGMWTLARVGARDYVDLGDGLSFRIGSGRLTKAVVRLQADDLYHVVIIRARDRWAIDWSLLFEAADVAAAELAEVVERGAGERS